MSDYIDNEIYNLCECIQDNGQQLKSGGMASIRFAELFRVSVRRRYVEALQSQSRREPLYLCATLRYGAAANNLS